MRLKITLAKSPPFLSSTSIDLSFPINLISQSRAHSKLLSASTGQKEIGLLPWTLSWRRSSCRDHLPLLFEGAGYHPAHSYGVDHSHGKRHTLPIRRAFFYFTGSRCCHALQDLASLSALNMRSRHICRASPPVFSPDVSTFPGPSLAYQKTKTPNQTSPTSPHRCRAATPLPCLQILPTFRLHFQVCIPYLSLPQKGAGEVRDRSLACMCLTFIKFIFDSSEPRSRRQRSIPSPLCQDC